MLRRRPGFTLVELLVVIAIIGVLASLLVPASLRAREVARQTACQSNLRQIIIAMNMYEQKNHYFPPGRLGCDCDSMNATGPGQTLCQNADVRTRASGASGFWMILPELDEQLLFSQHNVSVVAAGKGDHVPSPPNPPIPNQPPPTATDLDCAAKIGKYSGGAAPAVFICPSNRGSASFSNNGVTWTNSSYAMSMGSWDVSHTKIDAYTQEFLNNGVFKYVRPTSTKHVADGMQYTIFLGEATSMNGSNGWNSGWALSSSLRVTVHQGGVYAPLAVDANVGGFSGGFGSCHPGGAAFAFGDGHITFIRKECDSGTAGGVKGSDGTTTYTGPESHVFQQLSTIAGKEIVKPETQWYSEN